MATLRPATSLGQHVPTHPQGALIGPRPGVLAGLQAALARRPRDDLELLLAGPDQKLLMRTDPNDEAVARWICAAMQADRGEMYVMGLRQKWSARFQKMNVNLVAAERFMGAYEGSLGAIALGFQYVGKYFRESEVAEGVRKVAPKSAWNNPNFVMVFGRNGTPASSVDFTTRWALSGLGHRNMKLTPGGSSTVDGVTVASPFQCACAHK